MLWHLYSEISYVKIIYTNPAMMDITTSCLCLDGRIDRRLVLFHFLDCGCHLDFLDGCRKFYTCNLCLEVRCNFLINSRWYFLSFRVVILDRRTCLAHYYLKLRQHPSNHPWWDGTSDAWREPSHLGRSEMMAPSRIIFPNTVLPGKSTTLSNAVMSRSDISTPSISRKMPDHGF